MATRKTSESADSTEGSAFRRAEKSKSVDTETIDPRLGSDARAMLAEANHTLDKLRKPKTDRPSLDSVIEAAPEPASDAYWNSFGEAFKESGAPPPELDAVLGKMLTLCDLALTEIDALPTRAAWAALKKKADEQARRIVEQDETIAMVSSKLALIIDLVRKRTSDEPTE